MDAATPEEQQRLISTFDSRNGVQQHRTTLDPLGRHVATSWIRPLAEPGGPDKNDAELELIARGFLLKNADLLGIEPREIDALRGGYHTNVRNFVTLRLSSEQPIRGYEALGLKRNIDIFVELYRSGEIASVNNQSRLPPHVPLCTTPLLAMDDPAVRRRVIGQSVTFKGWGPEVHRRGPITEKDIAPPRLLARWRMNGRDEATVTLTYEMSLFDDCFTAAVDADTGDLIEIRNDCKT